MTLNDMIKRIKDKTGEGDPNTTGDFITAQIIRAINDARRDVVKILPQEAFYVDATAAVNTTQGTNKYSFDGNANDVEKLIVLHYTFGQHEYIIKKIESLREYYLNIFVANVAQNRPYAYVQRGLDANKCPYIEIYPTPDAPAAGSVSVPGSYSINYTYYKDPTKVDLALLDVNTEFPDMPSYVQDAIWKGGAYYIISNKSGADQQRVAKITKDWEEAKIAINAIENDTSDTDLQMRWDTGKIRFVDPATGIRLM